MPLAIASAPSDDLHAAYLDYLRRTGRGNAAYSWAARGFFDRWPDPRRWAAEPLQTRLSAGTSTRPIITFLMLHRALQPGYDYLLERKLSSIWREIKDSPLCPDLDRFMTAAAGLGFTERVRFATGSQVPARLLIQTGHAVTFTAVAARTGLGRTTLYRNPALRAVIDEHRHRTATSGTLAGLTDEIATLRTAIDALATRVRRHEEQLRRLTAQKPESVNRPTPGNQDH